MLIQMLQPVNSLLTTGTNNLWTILSLEQGMQFAMRTRRRAHVAAEPTTEPEFLINNVAEALKWAAQLKMFTLNKDSMSHMNIP